MCPFEFTNVLTPSIVSLMTPDLELKSHDESLIAYLGTLSVAQRLALNDAALNAALKLRKAFGHALVRPR